MRIPVSSAVHIDGSLSNLVRKLQVPLRLMSTLIKQPSSLCLCFLHFDMPLPDIDMGDVTNGVRRGTHASASSGSAKGANGAKGAKGAKVSPVIQRKRFCIKGKCAMDGGSMVTVGTRVSHIRLTTQ